MAEGHTIHALARRFSAALVGEPTRALSPQGTFALEAAALDGRVARSAQAYGKNLVVDYGDTWLHVHLGMFGRFQVRLHRRVRPSSPPLDLPLRGEVRLRLVTLRHVGDLRAPTRCELLDAAGRDALLARRARTRSAPTPIRMRRGRRSTARAAPSPSC